MRTVPIAFLLALLAACGAPAPPEVSQPETAIEAAPSPGAEPEPPVESVVPPAAEPVPAPPAAAKPPSPPKAPAPVAVTPAPAEAPPTPEPPGAEVGAEVAPAIDLAGLEERLKDTPALGVLTKLALKNEIDDLIDDVRKFHRKQRGELPALHQRFELLVMKVTSLLQDKEPELAREIAGAREGLWKLLADPSEFAKLSA